MQHWDQWNGVTAIAAGLVIPAAALCLQVVRSSGRGKWEGRLTVVEETGLF